MPKHVETLLTNIGIPADDVAKIIALPEADQATFDTKPYLEKVKANYQTQFKNDAAFFDDITIEKLPIEVKKKIEAAQFGRSNNIVRDKVLKGMGFTDADLEDLSEEQKQKIELFIPAVTEKWTKKNSSAKEIQDQLIAERRKNEEMAAKFGDDYEKTIETKYQTQAEQKVTAAIFNASLIGELSAIPGLKIAAADIAATANNILQSKYGFERIGDYQVELRQKANPQMKVLKEGSSHELTLKDALIEIATERGWIEKEGDSKKTGSGVVKITPQNGQLTMKDVIAPHLMDKISSKIAAEK